MKPEQQLAAMALHLGWTRLHMNRSCVSKPGDPLSLYGVTPCGRYTQELPWIYDLNAMHKAVMNLDAITLTSYIDNLLDVCLREKTRSPIAEASHQLEAFLRTIGKWEGQS